MCCNRARKVALKKVPKKKRAVGRRRRVVKNKAPRHRLRVSLDFEKKKEKKRKKRNAESE
jgi:hypothetical protein